MARPFGSFKWDFNKPQWRSCISQGILPIEIDDYFPWSCGRYPIASDWKQHSHGGDTSLQFCSSPCGFGKWSGGSNRKWWYSNAYSKKLKGKIFLKFWEIMSRMLDYKAELALSRMGERCPEDCSIFYLGKSLGGAIARKNRKYSSDLGTKRKRGLGRNCLIVGFLPLWF